MFAKDWESSCQQKLNAKQLYKKKKKKSDYGIVVFKEDQIETG